LILFFTAALLRQLLMLPWHNGAWYCRIHCRPFNSLPKSAEDIYANRARKPHRKKALGLLSSLECGVTQKKMAHVEKAVVFSK
jgi:hypothetical protein